MDSFQDSENVSNEQVEENRKVNEASSTSTETDENSKREKDVQPSFDDSENIVTNELNIENCTSNKYTRISIKTDEENSETSQVVFPAEDSASVLNELKSEESEVITTSSVVDENSEHDINNINSCNVFKSSEQNKFERKYFQENSEPLYLENEATNQEGPEIGFSLNISPQREDNIVAIRSSSSIEQLDLGVPGCTYCERERLARLMMVEEEQPVDENCWKKFSYYMEEFVNSWFMVGIQIVLVIWAYVTVFVGYWFYNHCIFMGLVIDLFIFVGGIGVVTSGTRLIVSLIQKLLEKSHYCMSAVVATQTFYFVWAYSILLIFFILNGDAPTLGPGPYYCDLYFYNFMIINTWVTLGVLILLAFLYISAYSSYVF